MVGRVCGGSRPSARLLLVSFWITSRSHKGWDISGCGSNIGSLYKLERFEYLTIHFSYSRMYTSKKRRTSRHQQYQYPFRKPADSMPCGIICQLHYDGGGSVQYHDASGASVCLPFLQGAKLRIGQQVAFAVSQRGEAIDIEVCGGQQENSNKNAGCDPLALEISDWIPPVLPTTKVSRELQTRRLQRSIGKFNNATPDERMEMLTQAEGLLENLLNEATLDGNAICRLVCRCVGWLHLEKNALEKNAQASVESKCVADAVAGCLNPPTCSVVSGVCWSWLWVPWIWATLLPTRQLKQRWHTSPNWWRRAMTRLHAQGNGSDWGSW